MSKPKERNVWEDAQMTVLRVLKGEPVSASELVDVKACAQFDNRFIGQVIKGLGLDKESLECFADNPKPWTIERFMGLVNAALTNTQVTVSQAA